MLDEIRHFTIKTMVYDAMCVLTKQYTSYGEKHRFENGCCDEPKKIGLFELKYKTVRIQLRVKSVNEANFAIICLLSKRIMGFFIKLS